MTLVILVGSIASGKTSAARILRDIVVKRLKFKTKYVDINLNHGFGYILTRALRALLRYTYVGNHYLAIRFNNEAFFCKYLGLMVLLDTFYIPIKYFTSLKVFTMLNNFMKSKYVIFIDEYYLNAIIDYLYFLEGLCRRYYEQNNYIKNLFKIFYNLAYRVVLRSIKNERVMIIHMDRSPRDSISGWLDREKTTIVDKNHIIFRRLAIKVILSILKQHVNSNVLFKKYFVQEFPMSLKRVICDVLNFIGEDR